MTKRAPVPDDFSERVHEHLAAGDASPGGVRARAVAEQVLREAVQVEYDTAGVLEELTDRHGQLTDRLDRVRDRVQTAWTACSDRERQLTHFEARYTECRGHLEELETDLRRIETRLDRAHEGRNNRLVLDELATSLDDAEADLKTAAKRVEAFERWLSDPAVRAASFRSQAESLTERVRGLADDVETFHDRVREPTPQSQAAFEERLDAHRDEHATVTADLEDLRSRVEAERAWYDRESASPSGSQETIREVAETLDEQQSVLDATADRLDAVASELQSETWQVRRQRAWLDTLTSHRYFEDRIDAHTDLIDDIERALAAHEQADAPIAEPETAPPPEVLERQLGSLADELGFVDATGDTPDTAAGVDPSAGRVRTGPDKAYAQHISNISLDLGTAFSIASVATGVSMSPDPVAVGSVVMAVLGTLYEETKVDIREEDGFVCWVAYETGAGDEPISVETLREELDRYQADVEATIASEEITLSEALARLERRNVIDITETEAGREIELNMRVSGSWT